LSIDRIIAPEKITIKLVKVKYLTSRKGLTFSSEDWRFMVIGNKSPENFDGVVKSLIYCVVAVFQELDILCV